MVVPYQRHQKAKQQYQRSSSSLSVLQGLPFWIWDREEHRQQAQASNGNCCFNHVVGLPQKDKREYPLFDYEKILYDSLMLTKNVNISDFKELGTTDTLMDCSVEANNFKDKHLWVKKATGLGVTEFMLRLIAWLCTNWTRTNDTTTDELKIEKEQER